MTAACLMSTYQPLALSFCKGLGSRLWDQAGREYLDAIAGVAVTASATATHGWSAPSANRPACCCTAPTSTTSTGSSNWPPS